MKHKQLIPRDLSREELESLLRFFMNSTVSMQASRQKIIAELKLQLDFLNDDKSFATNFGAVAGSRCERSFKSVLERWHY